MLDEKEKARLEKICPVELDLPVFLALVQIAVGIGEEIVENEEVEGEKCYWCPASSVNSDVDYEQQTHGRYCPIRVAREHLYKIGLPLKKIRVIALVEIKTDNESFLRHVDETIYRVGEIKQMETVNKFVEKLLHERYHYLVNPSYTVRFVETEELKEYRY